jgi:hypothetical protein
MLPDHDPPTGFVDSGLLAAVATAHPDAMSRADGCPECVLNVEAPKSTATLTTGYRCAYLCADCGHAWTTDWSE